MIFFIQSGTVQLKGMGITTVGNLKIRSPKIELFNTMKLNGNLFFDFDKLRMGNNVIINGNNNITISDYCIPACKFYPAGDVSGAPSSLGIRYIVFNGDALIGASMFKAEPDAFYVIISKKDLQIDSSQGNELKFNGIIYCNGLVKLDIEKFELNGAIICTNTCLKNSITIKHKQLSQEQLNEITSRIQNSVNVCNISVYGEYEFTCTGMIE